MAMELRYRGRFLSVNNENWRVDILQESDVPFGTVGELDFDADEPVVIEWKHADKEEVICGSEATIHIISHGDRVFQDLYSIQPGNIRLDIYRTTANYLYWSGTLDPEFYEEPYERSSEYTVSLTFSDFGILSRLKYNMLGMQNLETIIYSALVRSKINLGFGLTTEYTSTYFTDETKVTLSSLSVRSENFYNEYGEAESMKSVVEGILQPLGLRMIQRGGCIFIYDINALVNEGGTQLVEWNGDSQTMGTDKVANNVKVTFSPYADSKLGNTEVKYTDEVDRSKINRTSDQPIDGDYYSWYPDYDPNHGSSAGWWDYNLISFTMFLSRNGEGADNLHPNAKFFHIEPIYGGQSEDGICWGFYTGGHGSLQSGYPRLKGGSLTLKGGISNLVFTSKPVSVPVISQGSANYYLRLQMDMLLDTRYNPFSSEGEYNEGGNTDRFKKWANIVSVPVTIELQDADGRPLYHYVNSSIATGHGNTGMIGSLQGVWVSGAATCGECWLQYYNPDDIVDESGGFGWKTNRHAIGLAPYEMYDSFKQMAPGQYMPYPPVGGYLVVGVHAGVRIHNEDETNFNVTGRADSKNIYTSIRWLMYKAPVVNIVRNTPGLDEVSADDIEYQGYLNPNARDGIDIETICGTMQDQCPTARGLYYRTSDESQLMTLVREGVTDHPEKLLIGTLYSQYATRHTTLSGEAIMDPGGLRLYTESNQPDKKFLMSGERQDLRMNTSEIMITEVNADEFDDVLE